MEERKTRVKEELRIVFACLSLSVYLLLLLRDRNVLSSQHLLKCNITDDYSSPSRELDNSIRHNEFSRHHISRTCCWCSSWESSLIKFTWQKSASKFCRVTGKSSQQQKQGKIAHATPSPIAFVLSSVSRSITWKLLWRSISLTIGAKEKENGKSREGQWELDSCGSFSLRVNAFCFFQLPNSFLANPESKFSFLEQKPKKYPILWSGINDTYSLLHDLLTEKKRDGKWSEWNTKKGIIIERKRVKNNRLIDCLCSLFKLPLDWCASLAPLLHHN